MAFIQYPAVTPVFPALPPEAWSVHKRPIYSTHVDMSAIGKETMIARALFPRWAFTLTYGGSSWLREQTQNIVVDPTMRGLTEMEKLTGLYIQCKGAYGEFYYSDPDDNSRSNMGVGVGDGTTTLFHLFYTWGTDPFAKIAWLPVTGIDRIDNVYFNGHLQDPSTYGVDTATNTAIVFNTPPPNGQTVTADFHFFFRCHFAEDNLDIEQWAHNLWEAKTVKFESVKR